MPISLRDGETMTAIDFALPKGSVISVRLTDEFGEPVAGAVVQAQRFQWGADGQRRLTRAPSGGPGSGFFLATDDRGEIRIFGLMPGDYIIEARGDLVIQGVSAGNDAREELARTFYPGTLSADQARPVPVGIGEEISIQYAVVTARLARVSGTAVDSQGRPASGASISLVTASGGSISSSAGTAVRADGTFVLSGVAPGEHSLRFNTRVGETYESAAMPITVTGDIAGLSVMLTAGVEITGRVIYEGTVPPRGQGWPTPLRVAAADPQRQIAQLDNATGGDADSDGNFTISNAEGRVLFTVPGLPPTWMIKSVTLEGRDITDVPLELARRQTVSGVRVTLTDKVGEVAGYVTDAKGQNLSDYVVVIQPAEQKEPAAAARIVRAARPDTNGRFEVRGLRTGRYLATAIESMEQNRQYSPEFQKELRRGAREFSLKEGETLSLDLRLTEGL
jgi:hypothetical protein